MVDTCPVQNQRVAYTVIEGEAALVHPADSSLYWLNPVATRIWELSTGENTISAIADALFEEFDVAHEVALKDAMKLIESLSAKQLVELREAA